MWHYLSMLLRCVRSACEAVVHDLKEGKSIRSACLFMGHFLLAMLDVVDEGDIEDLQFFMMVTPTIDRLLGVGRLPEASPYAFSVCMNRICSLSQADMSFRLVGRIVM